MTATCQPAPTRCPNSFTRQRASHWDTVAGQYQRRPFWTRYYHRKLRNAYRFLVPPGQRVLEIGCGQGDLLAAIRPSVGVGVDLSQAMVGQARRRYPRLRFLQADAHDIRLDETFDFIILSDLVNDLWDVQTVLEQVRRLVEPRTRLILNLDSRVWQLPLNLARRLGLARRVLPQNWLTSDDVANLLDLADFEVIRNWSEILWPIPMPGWDTICNRFLVRLWPFRLAALTNFLVARPRQVVEERGLPSVSVIVPARNEAGNIPAIFERLPEMGRETELIFVEGHSRDDTRAVIAQQKALHPDRPCQLLVQNGVGKGDAVRQGFAAAQGDILMILDADLTVPPEDLARFYAALRAGKGEFINGVRLVYPMEPRAMRFLNLLGNKFFSLAFTWLLGQPIKDTLCGTKALWNESYQAIAAHRSFFGDFDPFGDFDLLFGSAKLNLKLVDMPVRYRERTYGTTNIQRWKHGWLLLKMVAFAARRVKFS